VMEAMSLGKIVLASVQGGQREMIENGENGFLFDHQKPSSFKESLSRILEMNDEEVIIMGQKARERVKASYNFHHILARKKALLDSLISPAPAGPIGPALARAAVRDIFPFLHQEKRTAPASIGVLVTDASLLDRWSWKASGPSSVPPTNPWRSW